MNCVLKTGIKFKKLDTLFNSWAQGVYYTGVAIEGVGRACNRDMRLAGAGSPIDSAAHSARFVAPCACVRVSH